MVPTREHSIVTNATAATTTYSSLEGLWRELCQRLVRSSSLKIRSPQCSWNLVHGNTRLVSVKGQLDFDTSQWHLNVVADARSPWIASRRDEAADILPVGIWKLGWPSPESQSQEVRGQNLAHFLDLLERGERIHQRAHYYGAGQLQVNI
jgi:hypothetical protein